MHISDLPEPLPEALQGKDLIVFDATCLLCSRFFRFMAARDHSFHFAAAQSPLGEALYTALALPTDPFETNIVIRQGEIHTSLDAFAAAMAALPLPWRALGTLAHLPAPIKTTAYSWIARNRYRLTGRPRLCPLPDAALKSRFLQIPGLPALAKGQ